MPRFPMIIFKSKLKSHVVFAGLSHKIQIRAKKKCVVVMKKNKNCSSSRMKHFCKATNSRLCPCLQDDAKFDPTCTSSKAVLLSGQREPGESHPTQTPLPSGMWRKRLSLWGTRMLEVKPASHSRHFLFLVRRCNYSLKDLWELVML